MSPRQCSCAAALACMLAGASFTGCAQTRAAPDPLPATPPATPAAAAIAAPAALHAAEAWTWAGGKGRYEAPAFVVLDNDGPAMMLVGASSPIARRVEMRAAVGTDAGTKYRAVEALPLTAHARTSFGTETNFLALIGVDRDLAAGDSVPLTLRFADGTRLDLVLQVRPAGSDAGTGD